MNEVIKQAGAEKAKVWVAILIAAAGVAAFYTLKGEQAEWIRWVVFVGALALGLVVLLLSDYGRGMWKFVLESRIELYKVFWPTRQETGTMTIVVFVFVIIMSVFFWGIDTLITWLTGLLLGSTTGTGT